MTLTQRASKGILWAQAGKLVELTLGFSLSVIIIRQLGPVGYGQYGIMIGLIYLGIFLSAMGFTEILGRQIPREQLEEGGGASAFLLRWTLGWRIVITLIVMAVFLLFSEQIGNLFHISDIQQLRWPVAMLFVAQSLLSLILAFFAATLRMQKTTIVNTVVWSVNLFLIMLIIARTGGVSVDMVMWITAFATGLGVIVALWLVRSVLVASSRKSQPTNALWRYGTTVWLTGLANYGLDTQSDVLLMGMLLTDTAQIGLYKAAVMPVQRVMGLIFGGWASLTMPVISEASERGGNSGIQRAWQAYIKLDVLLGIPVLVLIAATAQTTLPLLYSESYIAAIVMLQLYALIKVPGFAVGHGLSTIVMQGQQMENLALRLRIVAAILDIGLCIVLIPRFGAIGAIIAIGVAGMFMWTVETFVIARRFQLHYPGDFLLKILLASGIGWLAVSLVPDGAWLWFAAQAVVFGTTFIILLALLKPISADDSEVMARLAPGLRPVIKIFVASSAGRRKLA